MYALPVNSPTTNASTHWRAIWILYLSGCTLALHIGKLPAALPLLIDEFNLSLAQAGNLVSIYAVLVAVGGVLCGVFVARLGYALFAVVGVGLCLFSSFAGAYSNTVFMLMLTRSVEGLGWIMGVVAIPVIMSALCADKDRPVVMGLWGAFMAVGAGTMLLLAPQLQMVGGWRLSWIAAAILSGAGAIAILIVCHKHAQTLSQLRPVVGRATRADSAGSKLSTVQAAQTVSAPFKVVVADLYTRGSVAAFACFLCYSFQYVSVTSFLPTLLVQDSGMPLPIASQWTALILIPNAIGNISAGWFINRGFKRSTILIAAALLMGVCALIALAIPNTTVRIVAALAMTGIGGVIPGTLFSTAAILASSAAGAGVVIGFMLTGTGLGNFIGPVLLTRIVEWSGHWYTGGLLCLFAGLVGAYFARWLKFLPAVIK